MFGSPRMVRSIATHMVFEIGYITMGRAALATTVTTPMSPHGGEGQVATISPTNTTAKPTIASPVLMAMAPSQ